VRSEREMLDLIVGTASDDPRIRAVVMEGSRASPAVPRDVFQDFDIVYVVTDVAAVKGDGTWIDRFGRRMIMQLPDDMCGEPERMDGGYCYLMQFADGTRIDLTLLPVSSLGQTTWDRPSVLLLDKDGLVAPLLETARADHRACPPTAKVYADCCNEFWWVCPYVAKGLWRGEVTYAKYMFDEVVRPQLRLMLSWYVGTQTGFSADAGKMGRFLRRHLEPELWQMLERTYADADADHSWDALLAMGDLFRRVAVPVAESLGYTYPADDDRRVTAHLRHVRALPADAEQIY